MGKYIIDLVDTTDRLICVGVEDGNAYTYTALVEGLMPYTEPDLEQVRKEAYEQGLSDAWEAARKATQVRKYGGYGDCLGEVFGRNDTTWDVFDYSVSEAIEKIRQYEQENQFHIGDEFETESGKRFVILKMDGKEVDRYIDGNGTTYCMISKYQVMRKTGRHFPEIAAVLQKMRGEQDG